MITDKQMNETNIPMVEFSLRKAGEIDEKFTIEFPADSGPWSPLHPCANFADRIAAGTMINAHNKKRRQGYFTSPFLVCYALVGYKGQRLFLSKPEAMTAGFMPPYIDTYTITEYGTITIHNHLTASPYFSLTMRVVKIPDLLRGKVRSIDIYVSAQSQLYVSEVAINNDINNELSKTDSPKSGFFRVASIESTGLDQISGFIHIPIQSTYIPDIEGNELPDENPDRDISLESDDTKKMEVPAEFDDPKKIEVTSFLFSPRILPLSLSPFFLSRWRVSMRLCPDIPVHISFTLLHVSLRFTGLSPPSAIT